MTRLYKASVLLLILKQENESQIEQFLQHHDDAQELLIEAGWGVKRPFGRQVLTGSHSMDGFYYQLPYSLQNFLLQSL
jgi:16S rRNA (cytosine967-C5)-methyltransferase